MKIRGRYMLKILIDNRERNVKRIVLQKVVGDDVEVLDLIEGQVDVVDSISKIVEKNGLKLGDIDEFAFADGSGSFTGIKNAAAVANILEWAVKKTPSEKLKMPQYGSEPNIG